MVAFACSPGTLLMLYSSTLVSRNRMTSVRLITGNALRCGKCGVTKRKFLTNLLLPAPQTFELGLLSRDLFQRLAHQSRNGGIQQRGPDLCPVKNFLRYGNCDVFHIYTVVHDDGLHKYRSRRVGTANRARCPDHFRREQQAFRASVEHCYLPSRVVLAVLHPVGVSVQGEDARGVAGPASDLVS